MRLCRFLPSGAGDLGDTGAWGWGDPGTTSAGPAGPAAKTGQTHLCPGPGREQRGWSCAVRAGMGTGCGVLGISVLESCPAHGSTESLPYAGPRGCSAHFWEQDLCDMSRGHFGAPQPGLSMGIMAGPAEPHPACSLQTCLPVWASPTTFLWRGTGSTGEHIMRAHSTCVRDL